MKWNETRILICGFSLVSSAYEHLVLIFANTPYKKPTRAYQFQPKSIIVPQEKNQDPVHGKRYNVAENSIALWIN